jgi:heme oxygenase (mycobilin-producing)
MSEPQDQPCKVLRCYHRDKIKKGMRAVITVANRIYVNQEYADAFEQRFRERAGLVDQMPGFISNQVLRPVNEGDPYVVFTLWNSRQDFLNWVRSDAFVKGHAQSGTLPKEAFSRANVLEMHEVVQDSSRVDLEPEPHGGPFKMH